MCNICSSIHIDSWILFTFQTKILFFSYILHIWKQVIWRKDAPPSQPEIEFHQEVCAHPVLYRRAIIYNTRFFFIYIYPAAVATHSGWCRGSTPYREAFFPSYTQPQLYKSYNIKIVRLEIHLMDDAPIRVAGAKMGGKFDRGGDI